MATLAVPKQEVKQELENIIENAVNFHGHFGPFLVLGIRMSLIGIRELGIERGNPKLHVTAKMKLSIPFSCVIDGIQVATQCTIGNRKLTLQKSRKISVNFQISEGNKVTVTLIPASREKLEKLLSNYVGFKEIEDVAKQVVSMPEKELFKVEKEVVSI